MNDTNTELKRFFIATMAILAWSVLTSLSLFSATILAHDFSFALFIQPLFLILTAVLFLSTFSSNFFPVNLHFYEDATSIDNLIFPIIGAFLSIGLAHFPIITIATVCVATVATVFAGAFSVGICSTVSLIGSLTSYRIVVVRVSYPAQTGNQGAYLWANEGII